MSAPYPLVRNRYARSTRAGVSSSPSRVGSSPISASRFLINSCIALLYFHLCGAFHLHARTPQPPLSADALYADRRNGESARRAAEIWRTELARDPRAFAAAWKLARASYWLGGHGPASDGRRLFEAGVDAGRQATAIEPRRPEGYFWMAANMGALAESYGLRQGMKYRKPIREALESVLRLDPAFEQGSADRALGRWYYKVPGLFGGDRKKSEEHLRKALSYNPKSVITHLFLAETLVDLGRKAEAIKELEAAIAAPEDPEWAPEDRRFKEQAKQLLAKTR
jgi:tetratricopeptide (TPR) repeat protein